MSVLTKITLFILMIATHALAAQPTTQPRKKLIEFGWDEPSTTFMRQHIVEMEKTPFDGCVFEIMAKGKDGKDIRFISEGWGRTTFTIDQLQNAIDDLKNTKFHRFTDNFLRFDVTPGDVDWFDDFSHVIANARLAARVAKEGRVRGILFDIEQYGSQLWAYSTQRDAKTKSFDQYAAQAHQRGREIMQAFQSGYPGLVIFQTFGTSLAFSTANNDKNKLNIAVYGLLAPFMDGMVEAAQGSTKIVDGYEFSYAFKRADEFKNGITHMRETILPIVADPKKYLQHLSCGFGIWMDQDWRKYGWDTEDFSKNYFSPEAFEQSVKLALQTSDQYVWIYTEKPQWWTPPSGKMKDLPQPYLDALRRAGRER